MQAKALKLKGVKQFRIHMTPAEKIEFIGEVYETFEKSQTIIFTNKKADAKLLQSKLTSLGQKAEILIGGIDVAVRDRIIDDFRKTSISTLICTNVLARGIDVPEVDLVINYDVPVLCPAPGWVDPDVANYMHRVGRTGRFGTDGVAVSLTSDETMEDMLDQIAKYYEIEINKLEGIKGLKEVLDAMRNQD